MKTTFVQLNDGWNAEPNSPDPMIEVNSSDLRLTFRANAFQFPEYVRRDRIQLLFQGCWRYRLGGTNDEGWYRGQCRFGQKIPWGEFYELDGDLLAEEVSDWTLQGAKIPESRHFLFYFRDDTFECDAASWEMTAPSAG